MYRFLLSILLSTTGSAKTLSIDDYLNEVKSANREFKSYQFRQDASRDRSQSSELIYTPYAFAEVYEWQDNKEEANPLYGDRRHIKTASIGLQKRWSFGLESKLSYQQENRVITREPIPPFLALGVPNPLTSFAEHDSTLQTGIQLELMQPLWRNFAGKQFRLEDDKSSLSLSAYRMEQNFRQTALLVQAEMVYITYALSLEQVKTLEDSVLRSVKLKTWVEDRLKKKFTDRADLYQAEAALDSKRLELEAAKKQRLEAGRRFNILRQRAGDAVIESVSLPLKRGNAQFAGNGQRMDVEALRQMAQVKQKEQAIHEQRFQPQLDLVLRYGLHSDLDDERRWQAPSREAETRLIGLKFSIPLSSGLIRSETEGLRKEAQALTDEAEQLEFAAREEWEEIKRLTQTAIYRLSLAENLERSLRNRLEQENVRQRKGITTTYQLISAENDYAQSRLQTVALRAELAAYAAKTKLYSNN